MLHVPPSQPDQVLVVVNPTAGRRAADREVDRFRPMAARKGLVATILTDLSEVADRANQWHAEGRLRALVGVGGDGTAAELVNRTLPGVPITLLAAGTANLLARHFGLAASAEELCRTVTAGRAIPVDAGIASGRMFLLMASCGLDADVVRRVHDFRAGQRGGHISYWTYVKPILQSIRSYQYPQLRVYCDSSGDGATGGPGRCLAARWALACNLPRYAWGVAVAPQADPADGLLDYCTFGRGSLWHGLRYVAAAQLGIHGRLADCTLGRARRLRFEADEPVPYQLDGDPGGFLPLDVEVLPRRLTLIVPTPAT